MPSGAWDNQYASLRAKIASYARKYGIDPYLAIEQIWQESKFNRYAVSSAGARGIAQFMPKTARRFRVDPYDIDSSLEGYGKYMLYLKRFFNGDMTKAVAAYNAGEGNIQRGRYPTETKNYVAIISARLREIGKSITSSSVGDLGLVGGYSYQTVGNFGDYVNKNLFTSEQRYMIAFVILIIILVFAFS